ncbi:nucleotide-diphospho-sugar transferase [Bipolaris maydis]|nr:nucleotide-diphospho-sugar transferase [Bipolaris maydis]KAJ6284315.1 glycosyltransferase [Bipolaris maydis]
MALALNSLWPLVRITGVISPLCLIAYFCLRVYFIASRHTQSEPGLGLAWFFLIVELFQYIPTILLYCNRILVSQHPQRSKLYFEGDSTPVVSVLITACGEDLGTILNVVKAACETDWPASCLNVILCDDGQSQELKNEMARVRKRYSFAYYTSRESSQGYKAGNLNHGLQYSGNLGVPASEFVAGLDVDMIVKPGRLRALMPHILSGPKMGMICPPQYFWNIPRNDTLRQDLDYFYAVTELVHEGLGAADCVGSGYLARREALEKICGFPIFSISEDTACSSLLLGKGWSVAYVDEVLQCGEMPETLGGHIKQRTRWTIGNIQTAFKINFRLWGQRVEHCTTRQRLAGFVFGAGSLVNSALTWLGFIGSPLALLAGYPFVVYNERWQLVWLLRLVGFWIFSDTAHKASMALFVGYRDAMRWDQADVWLVPYYTLAFLRGFILPSWLGGTKPGFVPSGSLAAKIEDRHPNAPSLMVRVHALILHQKVWMHVLYIIACILGFSLNLVRGLDRNVHIGTAYSTDPVSSHRSPWVFLLTTIGWPPMWWLGQLVSCWIPVSYVLWPPVQVTAEEALEKGNEHGIRYPKEEYSRPRRTVYGRLSDHFTMVILLYTMVAFAGSFYL